MAEDVNSEELAFVVTDKFTQAVLSQVGFCTIDIFVLPSINSDAITVSLPCLFFGQSRMSEFGIGVSCPENVVVISCLDG